MCNVKNASVSIYTEQRQSFQFRNRYLIVFSIIVLCRISNQANRQIKIQADQNALRMVQGMLAKFIVKQIIDPKGCFYDPTADAAA